MDLAKRIIKEPQIDTIEQYARRIYLLAAIYLVMFASSLSGFIVLWCQGRLFVTLTQRSNVETLTLVFFLLFFAYLILLSARGAWGALLIALGRLKMAVGVLSAENLEKKKMRWLGKPDPNESSAIALNRALVKEGENRRAFELEIKDSAGSLGVLKIEGVKISHLGAYRGGSQNLYAFTVAQIRAMRKEAKADELDILHWTRLDDEEAAQYFSLVTFAHNLEAHLGAKELWPRLTLTQAECDRLEQTLSSICPALRNESLLPDWEYSGEHKLPIVPEPLGLVSLTRNEKRVDPLTSMGTVMIITVAMLALFVLMTLYPPWVPG